MKRTLIAATLALSLIALTPSALAAGTVGASGQCFDDDGSGGDGHIGVSEDGSVERSGLADEENPENNPPEGGVVDAVEALTDDNGDPTAGNGCTSEDADQQDYLEVHAGDNQVCYDGEVNTESGACPTSQ